MSTGKGTAKSSEISSLGLKTFFWSLLATLGATSTGAFFALSLSSVLADVGLTFSLAPPVLVVGVDGKSSACKKALKLLRSRQKLVLRMVIRVLRALSCLCILFCSFRRQALFSITRNPEANVLSTIYPVVSERQAQLCNCSVHPACAFDYVVFALHWA